MITKNSLSNNEATLDLDSINTTASWAMQMLANEIREKATSLCHIVLANNLSIIDAESRNGTPIYI